MKKYIILFYVIMTLVSFREVVNVIRFNDELSVYGSGYLAGNCFIIAFFLFMIIMHIKKELLKGSEQVW